MGQKKIIQLSLYGLTAGGAYGFLLSGSTLLSLMSGMAAGLIMGLLYCTIEYFLQQPRVKTQSFKRVFLTRGAAYSLLIAAGLVFVFSLSVIGNDRFPGSSEEKMLVFGDWLKGRSGMLILFYSILAGFSSQLVYMLAGMKGLHKVQGVWNGKYLKPVEEERIFMVIGFEPYHAAPDMDNPRNRLLLLREILSDIQPLIDESEAELYRIEDENIILSWQQYPEFQWQRCIDLFWNSVQTLEKLQSKYKSHFSYTPLLKAGLHYDSVLVTEIGTEDRELLYSGKGLNFARECIKHCSAERSSMIVSERFFRFLPHNQELSGKADSSYILENNGQAGTYRFLGPLLHNN